MHERICGTECQQYMRAYNMHVEILQRRTAHAAPHTHLPRSENQDLCTLLIGSVVVKYPKYVAKIHTGSDVFGTFWC